MSTGRRETSRRWSAAALTLAAAYGVVRLYWTLGGRAGFTACDRRELTAEQVRTGCRADDLASLSLLAGWGAVGLCALAAGLVVAGRRGSKAATVGTWVVVAGLLVLSFPLHLLFEIPVGLAGHVTDWRDIGNRLVLLAGAIVLARCARGQGCQHPRAAAPRPAPAWMERAGFAAVLLPLVGWAVPHGLWMSGLAVGIDPETLSDLEGVGVVMACAVITAPVLGGLLTLGLARPWGQVLPEWVPGLGGRRVPRTPTLVAAGSVAFALTAYGVIGMAMMGHDIVTGETTWSYLAESWAVVLTEVLFSAWGAVIGLVAWGYQRLTRCRRCGRQRPRRVTGAVA